MTNTNPWSRIPNSEFHTVFGMRDWLRLKTLSDNFLYHRPLTSSYLKRQPNKSSQTQVEDFIAFGFNFELQKSLKEITKPGGVFKKVPPKDDESVEKKEEKEENKEKCSNKQHDTDDYKKVNNDDDKDDDEDDDEDDENDEDTNVSLIQNNISTAQKELSPFRFGCSSRLEAHRRRAAKLLNCKGNFLTILETVENENEIEKSQETASTHEASSRSEPRKGLGLLDSSIEDNCNIM